jgi:hypothetical protein
MRADKKARQGTGEIPFQAQIKPNADNDTYGRRNQNEPKMRGYRVNIKMGLPCASHTGKHESVYQIETV